MKDLYQRLSGAVTARRLKNGSKRTKSSGKKEMDLVSVSEEMDVTAEQLKTFVCQSEGQKCEVKAPTLFFIHSAYDITTTDIANCFDTHNSDRAYMTMMYAPSMFFEDSGSMDKLGVSWRVRGDRLTFTFASDPSWEYNHSKRVYLEKLRRPVYVSSSGTVVASEIQSIRCGVAFFKLTRCRVAFPQSTISFTLPLPGSVGMSLVSFFDVAPGIHPRSDKNRYYKVEKLVVSTNFLNQVQEYSMTLTPAKFTHSAILDYATAINKRVAINGTDIMTPTTRLDSRSLSIIAGCVYITSYIRRWEQSAACRAGSSHT